MLQNINLATLGKKKATDSFFLMFGEIDEEKSATATEWILSQNYGSEEEPKPDVLTMIINSPGGDLHAAWAIIDMMRGSSIPIRTLGIGQIASAGLLIFMAGEKGMRVLSENCSIMSHQYQWAIGGKHHELLAQTKEFDNTHKRLLKFISKTTGMSDEKIMKTLMPPQDVYLTAEEAKKLGLCDEVKSLK